MTGKEPYFASSISVEHYTPRYIWERAIRCLDKDKSPTVPMMNKHRFPISENWPGVPA